MPNNLSDSQWIFARSGDAGEGNLITDEEEEVVDWKEERCTAESGQQCGVLLG
jgi:hypothetical protein